MPFIYLQESKQFVNLAAIAHVIDRESWLEVIFLTTTDDKVYLEVQGADADHLRKCLAELADNWSIENRERALEFSF